MLLDNFLSIFPVPFTPSVKEHIYNVDDITIKGYELGKKFFNLPPLFTVRFYIVGDTMIDTGIGCFHKEVVNIAKENEIKRVLSYKITLPKVEIEINGEDFHTYFNSLNPIEKEENVRQFN